MDVQQIIDRFGHRLLWCTLGAMLALSPDTASAQDGTTLDACKQAGVEIDLLGLPGSTCQNQTQAPISYNGGQTQGWAYYCGGDQYVLPSWLTDGIAWFNSCFTEVESGFSESCSKADANFTNWCTATEENHGCPRLLQ